MRRALTEPGRPTFQPPAIAERKGQVARRLVLLLTVTLVAGTLAACSLFDYAKGAETPADEPAAAEALVTFFDLLQAGDYSEASAYYGGPYHVLAGYNPNVPPNDLATLWRNGCSVNGLHCLKVRDYTAIVGEEGVITFEVTFSTREGDLFVIGPCCGANETEQPPVSVFAIRVGQNIDGRYRVLDLPPYSP